MTVFINHYPEPNKSSRPISVRCLDTAIPSRPRSFRN